MRNYCDKLTKLMGANMDALEDLKGRAGHANIDDLMRVLETQNEIMKVLRDIAAKSNDNDDRKEFAFVAQR